MAEFLLVLIAAVVVGAIGFGVSLLITGDDPGIEGHEPDGRSVPLPSSRPLVEGDVNQLRFDTVVRGYRMNQVDAALRRAGYDIGYKEELIQVLEAEIKALREGRQEDADALRDARQASATGASTTTAADTTPSTPAESAAETSDDAAKPDVDVDEKPSSDDNWSASADDSWGRPSPVVK
ncbi:DivIVA domain-containing protein [Dactylosporangium sp. NPDC051484]|uniref:DivIVA domain-containing protein n=1 Tax=Dactylosporangium sp. NPDC051484 TaxID=3154942 RepID=UPI0034511129